MATIAEQVRLIENADPLCWYAREVLREVATVSEVAFALGVTRTRVIQLLIEERIQGRKSAIGGVWLVDVSSVLRYKPDCRQSFVHIDMFYHKES